MWFKLRVGEKTKRTNREDYCSPKKVQLSSKPPTSRLRKKRSRKFSRSYDAERSVRPAYPYISKNFIKGSGGWGKLLSSPFGLGAVLPARATLWSRATSARLQVRWGKTSAAEMFDLGAVCNPALIDAWLFVFYRCCICSGSGLVYG